MLPIPPAFAAAEVVIPCADLDATLGFFTALGFCLDAIFPADDPAIAVVSGHGLRLRLARGVAGAPGVIRLAYRGEWAGEPVRVAPNGTRVELVPAEPPIAVPPLQPAFVVARHRDATWVSGRAGMRYRDLIPGRLGGRFIASHIQIRDGGPVPDYVHYHRVRFQMIYCYRGWVRVVYEDQGEPFVLEPGDCVIQPPEIRHRVLEASPGLEVIELGSPAEHETHADHALALPTPARAPDRVWAGQRFVRHRAAAATWQGEVRDLGIAEATRGLAGARVVRLAGGDRGPRASRGELAFGFVLAGAVTLARAGTAPDALVAGDAFVVPPGVDHALTAPSRDLELLEVELPASA
jgi:quercetin dioxygenase-like cupin family protein